MRTRTTIAALVAAGLLATLTACEDGTSTSSKPEAAKTSASTELTQEQRDAARKAAGLPTEPKAAERQAYLDALNAIDPRIIKPGKEDQAVSRGINQCSSIKSTPNDRAKLSQLALERFTVDTRLPEISTTETGGKIVDAVRAHICPDF
ncbi:hypothetical protein PV405_08600 [Streptomyces sp. ME02-6979-3A]|uniref:hypothetical protein n=1 Tax=Streptomyces sp. ME02-6979-3A TaxID=3028673 RepID=UPI0029B9E325|nr:hypothetical protein [Streptomyces sp. ME02-6979-3A]MDX3324725.1 hypothetical protein [Streptomyces sp. ME02-6979-3A]